MVLRILRCHRISGALQDLSSRLGVSHFIFFKEKTLLKVLLVIMINDCSITFLSIQHSNLSTSSASYMPKKKLVRRGFEDPMSIVDEPSGWEHKFNFGNLRMYNNRHLKEHRKITRHFKDKTYIHNYGVQPTSIEQVGGIEEEIPEMVPEIGK